MAEITLSPLPYNSGTMLSPDNCNFCRLSATRFFAISAQYTPSYAYGTVYDVDNLRAATPVVTLSATQVLEEIPPDSANSGYRVVRLNDTHVLVQGWNVAGGGSSLNCVVYHVDPGTNTMTKVSNMLNIPLVSNISAANWASAAGVNPIDNVVLTSVFSGSTYQLYKIYFNEATGTLTRILLGYKSGLSNSDMISGSFAKVRNSNNWSFTIAVGTSYDNMLITTGPLVGNPASDSTWAVTPLLSYPASCTPTYLPLNSTDGLFLTTSRQWRSYSNGTPALTDTYFCSTATANQYNNNVFTSWLDSDYFILFTSARTTANPSYPSGSGVYCRIGKYTDPSYGETSPATISNLLMFSSILLPYQLGTYELYDSDLVLIYGRTTAGVYTLNIIYAPSGA